MLFKNFFKTSILFAETFVCLAQIYNKNIDIVALKKKWAKSLLKQLNISYSVSNSCINDDRIILVGNHISFLDIIVLMAIHPQVVFLSKKEVASWPIIGTAAKKVGTLFVDRKSISSKAKVRRQIAGMFTQNKKKQIHLAGFPSGTTSLTENLPWKKGLFQIAQESKAIVQPFKIQYTPRRECSYIDDDALFTKLIQLFSVQNKKVHLIWGPARPINDLAHDLTEIKNWVCEGL